MATLALEIAPHPLRNEVLTDEATRFLGALHHAFGAERERLLAARVERRARTRAGELPRFPDRTGGAAAGDWTVRPAPAELADRRVEITGPVDRKTVINALNSGAQVFMADFEDALSPTWDNIVSGQHNLNEAVRRVISFEQGGRRYRLDEETATMMVRPRGWHLDEHHVLVDGTPIAASLFDVGLTLFHNTEIALERGTGPYLYLPKLESASEAALWADVLAFCEDQLGLERGTIRVTVLIETLTAAFEMDEILYALRDHALGLNAGRWDYLFSICKELGHDPAYVLPDRAGITTATPFMQAYTDLLVQTCHRRGAHAMGNMSTFIPDQLNPSGTAAAIDEVRADKAREAAAGFDGTWVAHPGLVPAAREEFDRVLGDRPNQIDRLRDDVRVTEADLLAIDSAGGTVTEAGVRNNVDIGIRYLASWLGGIGAVGIYGLMEDTATSEICRAQLGQWVRHGVHTETGRLIDERYVRRAIANELDLLTCNQGPATTDRYRRAALLFADIALDDPMPEFLPVAASDELEAESEE